jgi:phosphate transport system substrate-binding protein
MKRKSLVTCVLLVMAMLVMMIPAIHAANANISVIVDGKSLATDPAPFIQNGRVLVPFADIFNALGAQVTWDASSQTVTATKGDTSVILTIGQSTATVGEASQTLDVPPQIVDGHTVVPLRFVGEALGAQVNWDSGLGQVVINSAVTSTSGALPATLSGNLVEDGSTSVQPLAQQLATMFMAKYPLVHVTINGGGSGVGIADAEAGKVDIGADSAALQPTDPGDLVGTTICKDAIVIVVNPSNPIAKLTAQQVDQLFSGQISNWGQLGGFSGQPVMVYTREAGSGTLTFFMQQFMGKDNLVATAKQLNSNGLIKQAVASNSNAIGFLSFGYLDSTVKALPINGVVPTLDSAKSGKYPYIRPFLLLTKGDPQGLAKDFIQYCLSPEVQPTIAQNYLTLQ